MRQTLFVHQVITNFKSFPIYHVKGEITLKINMNVMEAKKIPKSQI